MPATYKYEFLPKNRARALDAAVAEFYECKKQVKKLEEEVRGLGERMEFVWALICLGAGQGMPNGEMRKRVEAIVGEEHG